jgi:hypothetical protein
VSFLQQSAAAPGEIERALEDVYARPEFRDEPGILERFLDDFFDWLGGLFESGAADTDQLVSGAEVLLWTVLVVGAIGLAWLLFTIGAPRLRGWRAARAELEAGAELERRVSLLRRRAREAESSGDWRLALRLHFFAAVVGLGELGSLDYRDAWTNRELLERGNPSGAVRARLSPLMTELDEYSFGLRPTGPEEVQRFSKLCDELLGELAA